NAIIQAALYGVSIEGAILYCPTMPCIICSKMLINSRIQEIVYREGYPDQFAADMLAEAGIPIRRLPSAGEKHGGVGRSAPPSRAEDRT
ncbi:MAG TPA: hypothetical protein ENJ73_01230, partial [Desulfobacterales bacterium]|nr:hypothetical protein [Desulfobacterales bacterium]